MLPAFKGCTSHEAFMNALQKKQPLLAFACIIGCTLAHNMPLQNAAAKCLVAVTADRRLPRRGNLLSLLSVSFDSIARVPGQHLWLLPQSRVKQRNFVFQDLIMGYCYIVDTLSDNLRLHFSTSVIDSSRCIEHKISGQSGVHMNGQ